ncbi:Phosphoribosylformylglycinamidine cyclo-ligase [Meiothermus luteus]|jgi:phosphoribosylformylglycinamidine cyclo-ligase|uniref:Phosphoribosylformylglycinamidine cyclo-ligase n=1 Tax=Meiothermus luteus TaxID=2026184 RepID=A0A399EVL5_9DEIN|nr:phosphoribosylformylglycinamidine cyclo-ligase [Meiothermus luteus]RIH87703.1 Phosphoribosylformylglycinamidine cyclo-ligase [Meiothermus luteus]RMH53712.1 MAG: phosphoribosylformylglycinamidine cyclo-ligase [Deinococcota bacterium]
MNYREAGVDIGRKANALQAAAAKIGETYTPEVLKGMGAFGGMLLASRLKGMREPVLVASTDGVGTKTLLAVQTGRYEGLGFDLVHHSVNDILVQGARPLFFMDYIASARLEETLLGAVLASLAEACKAVGIPLLGGETAEMPGVYREGALELAGTIVGVVERDEVVDGKKVRPGDVLLALPSSGLHTNGYSLARRVFEGWNLEEPREELAGRSLAEALLEPHRCYLREVERLWGAGVEVKAMVHITGGGVYENLPRVLPLGLGAEVWRGSFPVPPIFGLIQRAGQVEEQEMYRVFNMGLGYILVVSPDRVGEVQALLPQSHPVGRIIEGSGVQVV